MSEALYQMRQALALSREPEIPLRLQYANLLHQTGHLRESMDELRHIIALQPKSVEALNNLAWLLATASDEKLRDGPAAVQCAERALHLPPSANVCVPGTLAAAYAEAGRYSEAAAAAEKAVKEETALGQTRFARMNQSLLENFYRAGKPFHEPTSPADATH